MSTNKHAVTRYNALDKCFRNRHKRFFMKDLIEACNQAIYNITQTDPNIQKRQIYDDIRFMESPEGWSIPLERIQYGKQKYYTYSHKFSINEKPLDDDEMNQLSEAISTLNRFKGLPQFEWMSTLLTNLEDKFHIKGNTDSIIGFEQNIDYVASEHLSGLFNAIVNQQVLDISYRTFSGKEENWTVHPYYIKQYNNRWFLLGLNESYTSGISTLPLDRIISFTPNLQYPYIKNESIDFDEYFDDVIGVTIPKNKKPESIILQFSPSRFPYIESKPIHGSMKVRNREEGIIELNIIPNKELEALILSFGDDVEVLQPEWFRNELKRKIEGLMKKYFAVHM